MNVQQQLFPEGEQEKIILDYLFVAKILLSNYLSFLELTIRILSNMD